MFWKFLLILAAALALISLGRLTLMVSVLTIVVKALTVALAALLIGGATAYLWKQFRSAKPSKPHRLIFKQ